MLSGLFLSKGACNAFHALRQVPACEPKIVWKLDVCLNLIFSSKTTLSPVGISCMWYLADCGRLYLDREGHLFYHLLRVFQFLVRLGIVWVFDFSSGYCWVIRLVRCFFSFVLFSVRTMNSDWFYYVILQTSLSLLTFIIMG